jgi:hypothetical protein
VTYYSVHVFSRASSREKIRPSLEQPAVAAASNGLVPVGAEVLALGPTAFLGCVTLSRLGQRTDRGWEPATGVVEGKRTFAARALTTRSRVRAARQAFGTRVVYSDTGKPLGTHWPKPPHGPHDWRAVPRPALDELRKRLGLAISLCRGERTARGAAVVVVCWLAFHGGTATATLHKIAHATKLAPSLVSRATPAATAAGVLAPSALLHHGHTLSLLIHLIYLIYLIYTRIEQRRRTPADVRDLTQRLVAADPALDGVSLWTRRNRELVRKLVARGVRIERIADLIVAGGPLSTGRNPAAVLRYRLERLLAETPAAARTPTAPSPLSLAAQAAREALEREAEQEASARPPGARSRDHSAHRPVWLRSIIAEILPEA